MANVNSNNAKNIKTQIRSFLYISVFVVIWLLPVQIYYQTAQKKESTEYFTNQQYEWNYDMPVVIWLAGSSFILVYIILHKARNLMKP